MGEFMTEVLKLTELAEDEIEKKKIANFAKEQEKLKETIKAQREWADAELIHIKDTIIEDAKIGKRELDWFVHDYNIPDKEYEYFKTHLSDLLRKEGFGVFIHYEENNLGTLLKNCYMKVSW